MQLIIGQSRVFVERLALAKGYAKWGSHIFLTGKTGTGKNEFARYIHQNSLRKNMPYVIVNCAAVTESLFESELFGHIRGAFTGAIKDRIGLFKAADGGIIFLDEIGDLSNVMQAKLLGVLESKDFFPVGSTTVQKSNFMLVTATNKDLKQEIEKNRFRHDLLYRINGNEINIPPLKHRGDDVLLISDHFLEQICMEKKISRIPRISNEVSQAFLKYDWPGNVRELYYICLKALFFAVENGKQTIDLSMIPAAIIEASKEIDPKKSVLEKISSLLCDYKISEKELIEAHNQYVYDRAGRNTTKAASIIGVAPSTLSRRLKI